MNTEQNQSVLLELQQFMPHHLAAGFSPFAYYDKHLDCIRVQIRDCSVKEERLNRFITILNANHAETVGIVGFSIKGVGHLFESLGLEREGLVRLVDIIQGIVSVYPDGAVRKVQDFAVSTEAKDLEVDFRDAA